MTDLQLGLIGLGAVGVVGVLAYNKWQEYRHRKVAERVMKADHEDILLTPAAERRRAAQEDRDDPAPYAEERMEPALAPAEDDPPWDDLPREPTIEVPDTEPLTDPLTEPFAAPPPLAEPLVPTGFDAPEAPPVEVEVPTSLLDPRIDFIVVMELVESVPAPQILYAQRDALMRISKPVVWVGFNERLREWETFTPETQSAYRRLRIGLQLADRRGPLSEADLSVFAVAMQQLADELMAVADMSPHGGLIGQAVDLDHFCADVDLQIGVHLVSRGTPFAGTKIRALAEAAGMALGEDGSFVRHDDEGHIQFRLQNFESTLFSPDSIKTMTTHGLTFLLDVPRVDHGERVFFQMVDLARRFADTLNGQLVDDNRQPLAEAQLDHIKREYVVKPQAAMAKFGLPAGSPQALRLFS